jgi:hypothetical protein
MRRIVLILAGFFAVLIAAVGYLLSRAPVPDASNDSPDVTIDIPRGNLYGGPRFGRQLEISPDGKQIAYVGQSGKGSRVLFTQTIGEAKPVTIPGTGAGNTDIRDPTFSSDGRYLAYWAQGILKKTTLDGTENFVIGEAPSPRGIGWLDNDTLVVGNLEGALLKMSASQKPAPLFEAVRPGLPHVSPNVLPGNKGILFTVAEGPLSSARIWIVILETGEKRQLFEENAYAPRYVPSGHIVFGRGPNRELMAVRFDLSRLEVVGPAQAVLSVPLYGTGTGGSTDYAISETGVLAYTPYVENGSDTARAWLGDPTRIHVRLNWFDELNRLVP